jgi:Leucine-rich repeat (LRR) protein
MNEPRTYRVDSRSGGVEGAFTADALLSLARAGALRPGDRIERAPGQWVPVAASPQIRAAMSEWSSRLAAITSTNPSAALLGVRSVGPSLARERCGRASLLALAAQHGDLEVGTAAAQVLARDEQDGLGALARQVVEMRRRTESGSVDLDLARKAVVRALADAGWAAFVEAVRRIRPWDGVEALWRPEQEGMSGARLLGEPRARTLRSLEGSWVPSTSLRQTVDVILAAKEQLDADELWQLDLSGHPIEDLERLPSRALDVIRRVERVDLRNTPIREVPSWLFEGKSYVNLSSTPLGRLPEIRISKAMQVDLDIDLEGTQVQRFPESWGALRLSAVYMTGCPLHPRGLEWMPMCDRLLAARCGLSDVEVLGSAPRELDLSGNRLARIPDALRDRMNRLQVLDLSSNLITDIPAWLADAPKLRELRLDGNRLTSIDFPISSMPDLRELRLQSNFIAEIAEDALSGRRLLSIDLSENRLASMPPILYPTGSIDLSQNPLEHLPIPLNDPADPEVEWRDEDESDVDSTSDDSGSDGDEDEDDEGEGDEVELEVEDIEIELEDSGDSSDDDDADVDEDDEDAEDDSEDQWSQFAPFQSERENWTIHGLSITACETDITSMPPELLDLKISSLSLGRNRRLRAVPVDILAMPSLTQLDLDACPALESTDAEDRRCWAGWPSGRRAAVEAGRRATEGDEEQCCSVDLSESAFREAPHFLARALRRLELRLHQSAVRTWPAGAVKADGLESLDLSGTRIGAIDEVKSARMLKRLELPEHAAVPPWLAACANLESLDLPGLPARDYPAGLASLSACGRLTFRGRALAEIPRFVGSLASLEYLRIERASVAELPAFLGQCRALKSIYVESPALSRIAPEVLALPSLEELEISGGPELSLPEFPAGCRLERLEVSSASVVRIPASITRCASLRSIALSNVRHVELPDSIGRMAHLQSISLPDHGGMYRVRDQLSGLLPATEIT